MKRIKTLFTQFDQLCQSLEETSKDAAKASEKLVVFAQNFTDEQKLIHAEKRKQLELDIANGKYKL